MARKEKMVTRTILVTTATVKGISIDTEQVTTVNVELTGDSVNEKDILAYCENDNFKPFKVETFSSAEYLFVMSESTYIAHATRMPARGTKEEKED